MPRPQPMTGDSSSEEQVQDCLDWGLGRSQMGLCPEIQPCQHGKIHPKSIHTPMMSFARYNMSSAAQINLTIPPSTPPGKYLFRVEHWNMVRGGERGGAELFTNCAHIEITGSGTGRF